MSKSYRRCEYISDSVQCDQWYDSSENAKFCVLHREGNSEEKAEKLNSISLINEQRVFCYQMSFDEIEAHILNLEKLIENERTKLLTARAVREEKLEGMNEEERKERRKYKIQPRAEKSEKISSLKKDPIAFLMNKHGLTREQAEKLLG